MELGSRIRAPMVHCICAAWLFISGGFSEAFAGASQFRALDQSAAVFGSSAKALSLEDSSGGLFGIPGGCNGEVNVVVAGEGGRLLIGGREIQACEDQAVSGLIEYDPQTRRFRSLAATPDFTSINAIVQHRGEWIVGTNSGISRLAGGELTELPMQPDTRLIGAVYALLSDGQHLFVGGKFEVSGAVTTSHIAMWDTGRWQSLGSGIQRFTPQGIDFAEARALTFFHGQVVVGGRFVMTGGIAANRIARWNGSAWSAFGVGATNGIGAESFEIVNSLYAEADRLCAGGDFEMAGVCPPTISLAGTAARG